MHSKKIYQKCEYPLNKTITSLNPPFKMLLYHNRFITFERTCPMVYAYGILA